MIAAQDSLLLISRVLMGALFFNSARDKFQLAPAELKQVESLGLPVPAFVMVLTGVFESEAGAALVLGVYARFAALALTLFMILVSLVFVRFWSFEGPVEIRTMQRNAFFGNAAVTGGLIYVAVFGPGRLALVDF